MSGPRIGTAPVSYGIFGDLSPEVLPTGPQGVLDSMAAAGYTGSELGPPGFFGTAEQTARAFADAGLTVIGAYVPLHLALPDDVFAADLEAMRQTCAELTASGNPDALAVIADEGDDQLRRNPFRTPGRRERGLDEHQWARAADRLEQARELARGFGLDVSFHPHFATYVEQGWEIDRLLETTDLPLCLDTGHVQAGGADPVAYARRWAERINHVHVKDIHTAVLDRARAAGDEDLEHWWADLCCPLGAGDVNVGGALEALLAHGYAGWAVVEQDAAPVTTGSWDTVVADQRANRDWVVAAGGSAVWQAS